MKKYLIDSMVTFNEIEALIYNVEDGILVVIDGSIQKHFDFYDNAIAWLTNHGFEW